jgi:hypothetical protein
MVIILSVIVFHLRYQQESVRYDGRRISFKKQLELLRKIDPKFEERGRQEILEILKENPFADGLPNPDTI